LWLSIGLMGAVSAAALAQGHRHGHGQPSASPYAGEEARAIKSLSAEDIAELRRGGGWGLAKAAELNGYPGPMHLLDLKEEVALSPAQVSAVQALFEVMRAEAVAEGQRLIALEEGLEAQFRDRRVSEASLGEAVGAIAESRGRLRFIHLSAHLKTAALLRPEQVERYNALRGYAEGPCARVPAGHDPAMWKKHNGCG